jgi:hypothetical protein
MTNFGSIDVPKLELSAHWTFAKDDRRCIRQRGSCSRVDDIRDLRLGKRVKRQVFRFGHDDVLRT